MLEFTKYQKYKQTIEILQECHDAALDAENIEYAASLHDDIEELNAAFKNPVKFLKDTYEQIVNHFNKSKKNHERTEFYNVAVNINKFYHFYEALSDNEKENLPKPLLEKYDNLVSKVRKDFSEEKMKVDSSCYCLLWPHLEG